MTDRHPTYSFPPDSTTDGLVVCRTHAPVGPDPDRQTPLYRLIYVVRGLGQTLRWLIWGQ